MISLIQTKFNVPEREKLEACVSTAGRVCVTKWRQYEQKPPTGIALELEEVPIVVKWLLDLSAELAEERRKKAETAKETLTADDYDDMYNGA